MNLVGITRTGIIFSTLYEGDEFEFTLDNKDFRIQACVHRVNKGAWEVLSLSALPMKLLCQVAKKQRVLRELNDGD